MKRSDFIRGVGILGASALSFRLLNKAEAATSVLQLSTYPDPLPVSGALSQAAIFDYFKKALMENESSAGAVGFNPEEWPYFNDIDFLSWSFLADAPSLPMSRSQFYNWIDIYSEEPLFGEGVNFFGKIAGQPLYAIPAISNNWPVKAVNDWAKIKSLELALFGDLANGGDLSKMSDIGSGNFKPTFLNATRSDLYLLRHALVKFDTYGECHDDTVGFQVPAPTGFNSSVSPRNFSFSYAPGYSSPGLYEFSVNGGGWQAVTGNPQSLYDFPGVIPSGAILLRTASSGMYEVPSNIITNYLSYPSEKVYVYVSTSYYSSELTLSVMTFEPLDTTIVFEIAILNNFQQEFPREVTLLSGQTEASEQFFGSFSNVSIHSVEAYPTTTSDGREIEITIM